MGFYPSRPRIFELSLLTCLSLSLLTIRSHAEPFASDPNVKFATEPLKWEKTYSFSKTALVRYPFHGDSVYSEEAESVVEGVFKQSGRWNILSPSRVQKTLERDVISMDPYSNSQLKAWATEWDVDSIWVITAEKRGASVNLGAKLWHKTLDAPILEWSEFVETGVDFTPTRTTTQNIMRTLLSKIPFDGEILSRTDKRVTFSIGTSAGVKDGQIIVVTRIQAMKRRPDSEIIDQMYLQEVGRIKVTKAESDLSFAEVLTEKDNDPILVSHKIVVPMEPQQDPIVVNNDTQNRMEKVAFGTDAQVWNQRRPPHLGFVGLLFGLGSANINDAPTSGASKGQHSNWAPSVRLDAELWLAKAFFLNTQVQQTMLGVSDTSAGLGLNSMATSFSIAPGFRYLVEDKIDGPQVRFMMGYAGYYFFVDSSATATSLTSSTYDGFTIFADAMIPFSENKWNIGLGFTRTFFTSLSESVPSGGSNNSIAWTFFFRGGYRLGPRWAIEAALRYESYSSTFQNASRFSSSVRTWHLQSGINYYF